MRKSTILKRGTNNKVLVKWAHGEYSVHTLGLHHTEEEHDLIWGHYFGTSREDAEQYFEQYKLLY